MTAFHENGWKAILPWSYTEIWKWHENIMGSDERYEKWKYKCGLSNQVSNWQWLCNDRQNIILKKFKDFFINIGSMLARSIPNTKKSLHIILTQYRMKLCFEHQWLIRRLKSIKNTATDFDEINTMPLKLVNQFISQPFTHLCNLSLTRGVWWGVGCFVHYFIDMCAFKLEVQSGND